MRIIFNLTHKENVSRTTSQHNLITIKHMNKAEIGILMFVYIAVPGEAGGNRPPIIKNLAKIRIFQAAVEKMGQNQTF